MINTRNIFLIVLTGILLFSCQQIDNKDLEREVVKLIEQDFGEDIKINSLTLINVDGNEYAGLLLFNDSVKAKISVVAEENSIIYNILDSE